MNWKTYERLGRDMNELEFRKIFEEDIRKVEDIRKTWTTYKSIGVQIFFRKTDEGSGRHTNELEIRKIFEEDIRKKWKIYERLGQHTNELEFRKIF